MSDEWEDDAPSNNGSGFNWDDEAIQPTSGEFLKFPNIGDKVIGTITALRKQRFFADDGGVEYAPQLELLLDDGTEATMTAGAWHLKKLLIEKRPNVGDRIRVVHTGKQGRSKLFTLDVKPGEAKAPAKSAPRKAAKATAAPAEPAGGDDDGIPF